MNVGRRCCPALLFLAVGCAALLLAFGSLQLTSAKIQLQNTADASAYAAALLQARGLQLFRLHQPRDDRQPGRRSRRWWA
ncbi:hypothetical protein [Burkholderia gladioli]|uniref:hypothetical protein n=1 Tax=Burkholderia gladioli TaxID=28095 RepID=UPI003D22DC25